MRSVSPDIIDDIATDFRLGVQTAEVEQKKAPDELDVRKAAQTLLEIYSRLQAEQTREEGLKTRAEQAREEALKARAEQVREEALKTRMRVRVPES
jgi:hypothetical protein